jgi:RNA polymerase sigma factor (sigma-70 family)
MYKGSPDEISMEDYMNPKDYDEESYDDSPDPINNEYEEKLTDIQSRGMVVDELLSCLQEREIKILESYFGLHGEKQKSLKEISTEMNMSSERVRQIVNNSITHLKYNVLAGDYFNEYKDLR